MIQIKLFLLDAEVAEVLENIESLQHLQTFITLKQEILKKKMSEIMRPSNISKDFTEQGRLLGFREIQRSMSDNIEELEKTFITEVAPYINKKVLTELNNAELENLTEEFKSFNSGNLLRLLDPSIPTRSSDGKPLPKIKEVSNKMLDVREELLKRIQTTDNKSDWNIKAKANAHKLIKEAFTIQNPRSQLDETSVMFDLAEENVLKIKPTPDDEPNGPHPDVNKCICKGTGIITHGDGHTTDCPYHKREVASKSKDCIKSRRIFNFFR